MNSLHRPRSPTAWAAAVGVLLSLTALAALTETRPTPYVAQYRAFYKGRDVGSTQFSVRYDAASDTFSYTSQTRLKGLYKFVSPKPIVDQSSFQFVEGRILPIEFRHEDGSRSGDENQRIQFDWGNGTAILSGEHGTTEVGLMPGIVDRASLQIVLKTDLANGLPLTQYTVADDDTLKTYHFALQGDKTVETPIGKFEVVSYLQQRTGSSREMVFDFAPDLDYLPVRIEQFRDGESQSAFTLISFASD